MSISSKDATPPMQSNDPEWVEPRRGNDETVLDGSMSEKGGHVLSAGRSYVLLAVCAAIGTVNIMDRKLLSIASESIKAEFVLSDTQLGLLVGAAFGIFYSVFGLPLAYLADRYDRPKLIAICMAIWSFFTALTAGAANFVHLALCRIGVASGEAAATPTMYALIGDVFSPVKRPLALAIAGLGSSIGSFVALWFGGYIIEQWGWREAFVIFGGIGLLVAILVATLMPEPRRQKSKSENKSPPLLVQARNLLSIGAYRWLLCGTLFGSMAMYSLTWLPPFYMRVHGWTPATTGFWLGIVVGVTGIGGGLLVGALAGHWSRTDYAAPNKLCALLLLIGAPLMFVMLFVSSPMVSLLAFALPAIGIQGYSIPFHAAQQNLAPDDSRALAASLGIIVTNLGGLSLGAGLVGVISDLLKDYGVQETLRYALILIPLVSVMGAAAFWRSARLMPRAEMN